jgi:hypothetical protein
MWIKSSDTDLADRRLLEAGPLGRDLYHRAQLWMAAPANLTNGYISRRALRSLDDYADITENGKPVLLLELASRLVKLGLWRIDGDVYYDLRFADLNPAALIEKKKAAGRASAAARQEKYGTPDPRANAEHREQNGEQAPEQNVNRTRTRSRTRVGTVSKNPDQIAGLRDSREADDGNGDGKPAQPPPQPVFTVVKPLSPKRPEDRVSDVGPPAHVLADRILIADWKRQHPTWDHLDETA